MATVSDDDPMVMEKQLSTHGSMDSELVLEREREEMRQEIQSLQEKLASISVEKTRLNAVNNTLHKRLSSVSSRHSRDFISRQNALRAQLNLGHLKESVAQTMNRLFDEHIHSKNTALNQRLQWIETACGDAGLTPPRYGHSAVYDEHRDRVIVFGGRHQMLCADVWCLDHRT